MAYQPNIPLPTDRLRVSQGDLNGNFQTSAGGIGTMLNPNQGYIQFPLQVGVPTPTGSQPGIYGLTPALTGVEELYLQKNNNGPAFYQVPFTASTLSNVAPSNNIAGWTYLPSGILLKWGSFAGPFAATTLFSPTIPSSATVPAFTKLFFVQLGVQAGGSGAFNIVSAGVGGDNLFSFISNSGIPAGGFVTYFAIGY